MGLTDWYRIFTWLCLTTDVAIVALVGLRIVAWLRPAAGIGPKLRDMLRQDGLKVAALVAAGATAGSLYLSEGAHLLPCRLCWFQRIGMYPLAALLVIAAARRDWNIRPYALTLAGLGLAISTWHYLVEWFPSLEDAAGKCDPSNPCSALPVEPLWRPITIPFMAGSAFLFVILVLVLAGPQPSVEEPLQ